LVGSEKWNWRVMCRGYAKCGDLCERLHSDWGTPSRRLAGRKVIPYGTSGGSLVAVRCGAVRCGGMAVGIAEVKW
jgi:hypothetical protein